MNNVPGSNARPIAVGIDTGGTFTDCVLLDGDAAPLVAKVSSTPDDPSRAIMSGLQALCEQAGIELSRLGFLAHGTTVATNAMLEGRWGRSGLLATEGFRDVLEIGSQVRPEMYGLQQSKPLALVPRERRIDIGERSGPNGEEVVPLDEDDVRAAVRALQAENVESIAIAFLFAYAAPEHERRAAEIAAEVAPELYVCRSSEVSPELREHGRTSTTVINAALAPIVRRYLRRLGEQLDSGSFESTLHIMQSNGGLISGAEAERSAHNLILSGPAGGLIAAANVSESAGFPDVLTLDMGGTSCDVGLVVDGRPKLQYGTTVGGGHPLQIPLLDLHTIGAGGGSIAWRDAGGGLKVGPRSAGAEPGPACYGRGGTEPTITDANLFLGRLDPESFLAGDFAPDRDAAERALAPLAAELGLETTRAAAGVIEVANANMVGALRVVSTRRGLDPRDFALLSFGGAGSLHACSIAREMGIETVIVPPRPGLLSAVGIALSDIQHDYVRTWIGDLGETDDEALEAALVELEARARGRLVGDEGVPEEAVRLAASLDVRYRGQEYYLNVPLERPVDAAAKQRLADGFHDAHEANYGHAARGEPIEVVNLRLAARGVTGRQGLPPFEPASAGAAETRTHRTHFDGHGWLETPFLDRGGLAVGDRIEGPAIVTQMDTTVMIEPGQVARVDEDGNLLIAIGGEDA